MGRATHCCSRSVDGDRQLGRHSSHLHLGLAAALLFRISGSSFRRITRPFHRARVPAPMSEFVLAIDQGTTGTTTILVDESGTIARRAYREIPQYFPQPGWVEHDPEEIWRSVVETVDEVAAKPPGPIRALGLTNQRETT